MYTYIQIYISYNSSVYKIGHFICSYFSVHETLKFTDMKVSEPVQLIIQFGFPNILSSRHTVL